MVSNSERMKGFAWWIGQILAVPLLVLFGCAAFKVAYGYLSSSQFVYFGVILPFCVLASIVIEYKFRIPRFIAGVLSFVLIIDGHFTQGLLRAKFLDPEYYVMTLPLLGQTLIEGLIAGGLLGGVWCALATTVERRVYGTRGPVKHGSPSSPFTGDLKQDS